MTARFYAVTAILLVSLFSATADAGTKCAYHPHCAAVHLPHSIH